MNCLCKYEKLVIAKLYSEDEREAFDNCVILCGDNENFDVDLTGDCWFNNSYYLKHIGDVENVIPVKTLQDVYDYCKKNNIKIAPERVTVNGLLTGGEADLLINEDLCGNWISK